MLKYLACNVPRFFFQCSLGLNMDINLLHLSTNNGSFSLVFNLLFFLYVFGNCLGKIQTLTKKKTTCDGGFVSCFRSPCFSTLHPLTILFGPQKISCLCAFLFYLCINNTMVLAIVYAPKFVT
jgi:hypothetical protein